MEAAAEGRGVFARVDEGLLPGVPHVEEFLGRRRADQACVRHVPPLLSLGLLHLCCRSPGVAAVPLRL